MKINKFNPILITVIVFALVSLSIWLLTSNSSYNNIQLTRQEASPKSAVFDRNGSVYVKNFETNEEKIISKTSPVTNINFSPRSNYVVYKLVDFPLSTGGWSSSEIYLYDVESGKETSLGLSRDINNVIQFSENEDLLAYVSVTGDFGPSFKAVVTFMNLPNRNVLASIDIPIGDADLISGWIDRIKNFDFRQECGKLTSKTKDFCTNYFLKVQSSDLRGSAIKTLSETELGNGYDSLKKTDYTFYQAFEISDKLISLEYFRYDSSKEPVNCGTCAYMVGFSEEAKETYTLLVDKRSKKIVAELKNAVNTKFILK